MNANPPSPILVVDDEEETLKGLELFLLSQGYDNVRLCGESANVRTLMERESFSVMLLDLNMPGVSGEEILSFVTDAHPDLPVIVISGTRDVSRAVASLKAGAYDFFTKPIEPESVIGAVRRALEKRTLRQEVRSLSGKILSPRLKKPEAFSHIVTNSESMMSIFRYLEAIESSPEPVLILGESGTGKELLARAIYNLMGSSSGLVAVNLAGLDDAFFSDTLFGHVKGAYTGGVDARVGLVERARGGVLFLDEIGDLEPGSQVKLLRFLQDGEYYPLGSDAPKKAITRIVAATNRDLGALLSSGRFRSDLYYRLNAHSVSIPALRDRPEDIPLLAAHFLDEAAGTLNRKPAKLTEQVLDLLLLHEYPGNVRELRSMLFDAFCTQVSGTLEPGVLEAHVKKHAKGAGRERKDGGSSFLSGKLPTLKEAASMLIDEALRRTGGNQSRAAELLGITHQALSRRLKSRSSGDVESID
jgi:DNA-binding NtrC family response regulator